MSMVKARVPVVVPAPAITKLNDPLRKRPSHRSFLFKWLHFIFVAPDEPMGTVSARSRLSASQIGNDSAEKSKQPKAEDQ